MDRKIHEGIQRQIYVKDSYQKGTKFTQDETTDVSLKHRHWFFKLQGATLQQIQQSLMLHLKVLKEGSSNFESNTILQPAYETRDTTQVGYVSSIQPQYT